MLFSVVEIVEERSTDQNRWAVVEFDKVLEGNRVLV
jgi:hypothetical protein